MTFRMFGVNVEIQISFWIMSVLFGIYGEGDPDLPRGAATLIWVAVVLVSILLHEFGHAFAVMRHRIEPEISLYFLGGVTRYRPLLPLSRGADAVIALAGPFAGFILGGAVWAAKHFLPGWYDGLSPMSELLVSDLLWVNIGWGLVNLAPVLPLDGGHVLEAALGPRRSRLTFSISAAVGLGLALFFFWAKMQYAGFLFLSAAVQSYRNYASELPTPARRRAAAAPPEEVAPELNALLVAARHAVAEDDLDRAASIAQRVLEGDGGAHPVSARARLGALEVIAWTHLLSDRASTAAEVLAEARRAGDPDVALTGAVLFAQKDLAQARKVLERALKKGDDRKEVVGPLVQILLEQQEFAEAATVAASVIDTLSEDDARRMASLAFEHGAFAGAARLWEAIFDRVKQPEDAFDAARAEAKGGRPERALDLLRRAVEAGFSDRARAWSDAALGTLRGLDAVLPRP